MLAGWFVNEAFVRPRSYSSLDTEGSPSTEVSPHARSCNRIPITLRLTLRAHDERPGKIHRLG